VTDLGRYDLTLSFRTGVLPAPKDSKLRQGGFGEVTLKAAKLQFKVGRGS
jgi:hypothetical protein